MNIKNNINNRIVNILNHETLVDINDLMIYSDILINDYSTTSVDLASLANLRYFVCQIIKNIYHM